MGLSTKSQANAQRAQLTEENREGEVAEAIDRKEGLGEFACNIL